MDTLRCGADLDRIPGLVRENLMDVDRLRVIWAQHRQSQPRGVREAARRELVHRRVHELGGGPVLKELLVSTTVDGTSGQPLTAAFVTELAERTRGLPTDCSARSPERPMDSEQALRLAEAAAVPAHPVVRAAQTYAECVAVLTELGPDEEAEPHPWVLPWVLASLVLRRADFPPLLPDPLTAPPWNGRNPDERLAGLVRHFARLVTGALLNELSWTPAPAPPPREPMPPLAVATRRRILDYVRSRREPIALILRALDPQTQTSVYSGGSDDPGSDRDSPAAVAARTLLTPGAAHWWTALELAVSEASLYLFVVVQEVGRPRTGVLAVTAEAHLVTPSGARDTLGMSSTDSVPVMPTDGVDDRWPQVRDLVDEAVSRAMNELTRV